MCSFAGIAETQVDDLKIENEQLKIDNAQIETLKQESFTLEQIRKFANVRILALSEEIKTLKQPASAPTATKKKGKKHHKQMITEQDSTSTPKTPAGTLSIGLSPLSYFHL
jgi:hypothetical protein